MILFCNIIEQFVLIHMSRDPLILVRDKLGITSSITTLIIIFTLAAFIQLFLPSSHRVERVDRTSPLRGIREGFAYVMSNTNLKLIASVR